MKKRTPKKLKKRNPQDATLTNIRALKKRVKQLEEAVRRLEQITHHLESREITRNATGAWVGEIDCKRRPQIVIKDSK